MVSQPAASSRASLRHVDDLSVFEFVGDADLSSALFPAFVQQFVDKFEVAHLPEIPALLDLLSDEADGGGEEAYDGGGEGYLHVVGLDLEVGQQVLEIASADTDLFYALSYNFAIRPMMTANSSRTSSGPSSSTFSRIQSTF